MQNEDTVELVNMRTKTKVTNTIAQIHDMFCSDLILSRHLISSSPVARHYLQDCADQHTKLEMISKHVEIGLCTCAWLMG